MMASYAVNGFIMVFAFRVPFFLAKRIPALIRQRQMFSGLYDWCREEYEKHEITLDPDNPRDFLGSGPIWP